MPRENRLITESDLKTGLRLWDNKTKSWQKILRVYLWVEMIKEEPNRFYKYEVK